MNQQSHSHSILIQMITASLQWKHTEISRHYYDYAQPRIDKHKLLCTVNEQTGLVDNILSDYQKRNPKQASTSVVPLSKQKEYAMDMAGFCISTNVLMKKQDGNNSKRFDYNWESGSLESNFLKYVGGITQMSDFQPLANNCIQILVWHVKTTTGYENKKTLSLLTTDPNYNKIQPSV